MKTIEQFLTVKDKAVFYDGLIRPILTENGLAEVGEYFSKIYIKHGYLLYHDGEGNYFVSMSNKSDLDSVPNEIVLNFERVERDDIVTLYRKSLSPKGILNVADSPHYIVRRRWREGVALIVVYDKMGMELGHCEAKRVKEHLELMRDSADNWKFRQLLETKNNANLIHILAVKADDHEVAASSVEDFVIRYNECYSPDYLPSYYQDFQNSGFVFINEYKSITGKEVYWCGRTEPFPAPPSPVVLPNRTRTGNLLAQLVS